jgi:predicted O-methyltransferase YrrM
MESGLNSCGQFASLRAEFKAHLVESDKGMPPQNPILKAVHKGACAIPPLINGYRALREFKRKDPVMTALYRKLFDRGRLRLPAIAPEKLGPAAGFVELPTTYPLFAGEDAPLNDMLFLLNLAKGRKARRILEVGTYRARTTFALHLNCPEATLVSYDIQVLDSEFRRKLADKHNVSLRHASFAASAEALRQEDRYDLIFVDGSHQYQHVIEDSRLALEVVAPGGIVVWHDYRPNDYGNNELRVPEALNVIAQSTAILAVPDTMCAVYLETT